jgi:hypothetical protein
MYCCIKFQVVDYTRGQLELAVSRSGSTLYALQFSECIFTQMVTSLVSSCHRHILMLRFSRLGDYYSTARKVTEQLSIGIWQGQDFTDQTST